MIAILTCLLLSAGEATRREWTIDGVTREATVVSPAKSSDGKAPLIFGFHGHGGSMNNVGKKYRLQELWPEAAVVYMQGLNTPGKTDPEGKKPGWQKAPGDQGDRDLKFFDAVLATMREGGRIDERRIYCMGHSNGGGFTYLLWAARPGLFAAVAPSAAGGRNSAALQPLPAMHIAGRADSVVPFAGQERTMEQVRKVNGCVAEGKEWAPGCLEFASPGGTPFVSFIHPGDHAYPDAAPPLIVRFFKEHVRPEKTK